MEILAEAYMILGELQRGEEKAVNVTSDFFRLLNLKFLYH